MTLRLSIPSSIPLLRILKISLPGFSAILALSLIGFIAPAGVMATIRNTMLYINLSIPWVILFSLGYPSFASAAFFGVGAYITTYSLLYGLNPAMGVALSAIISISLALAIGYITLRLAGLFFFFATLAILEAIRQVMNYTEINLTGHIGKIVPIVISDHLSIALLAMLGMINIVIYSYLMATKHRIVISSIRWDKILAISHGINPYRYSTYIFALTSTMQAICGGISAFYLLYINPDSVFNPFISLLTLVIGLLGGYLNILGPIISSIAIIFLYEYTSRIAEYLNITLIGSIVIAVTLYLRTNISEVLERYIGRKSLASSTH